MYAQLCICIYHAYACAYLLQCPACMGMCIFTTMYSMYGHCVLYTPYMIRSVYAEVTACMVLSHGPIKHHSGHAWESSLT